MEILPKIADSIKRQAQGGISTEESKFSIAYLYQVIHEARATIIKTSFSKEQKIQSVWTQSYEPDYDPLIQDENPCSVKFLIPAPMNLDNKNQGFLYVGEVNGNCAYRMVISRAELSTYNNHRITKTKDITLGGSIRGLYSDGILELYGDLNLKKVRIDGIWLNPTLLPTYNMDLDYYPIDDSNLSLLKTYILQNTTGIEAKTPEDKKQDMNDSEGRSTK